MDSMAEAPPPDAPDAHSRSRWSVLRAPTAHDGWMPRPQRFAPREAVYDPDSEPTSVYVLGSGLVWQYRTSPSGTQVAVGLVAPGEVFGEAALFEAPVDHVAEAVRPSLVWEVPRRAFLAALEQHPAESYELARQLQCRSRRLVDRVESLALRTVRARFAHLLLDLAEALGGGHDACGSVELPFSQGEVASWIGSTRQTVSTLLAELDAQGLVQRSGRRLRLRDVGRLQELARSDGRDRPPSRAAAS